MLKHVKIFGGLRNKEYLCKLKSGKTMVVTARDFRANQSRYIGYAHNGEDVILKSRAGSVRLIPVETSEETMQERNKVYIENGEVKMDFAIDTMSIEEAKKLTLKAIELEYMLPRNMVLRANASKT